VGGGGGGGGRAPPHDNRRDDRHHHDSDFYGSWLISHRNNPPAPAEPGKSVISLAAGGVVIGNDIDPVGGLLSGTWDSRGGNRMVATLWGGFPAEGKDPAGTVRVQVSGRLRGGTVSGTFVLTVYPKGKKSQSATGTFAGSKIPAA
jgi:hypothetical protein